MLPTSQYYSAISLARNRLAEIDTKLLTYSAKSVLAGTPKKRVDQLKQFLFARFKEQQACILFIDESQQMKGSLLESLRGLLNFEDPAAGSKLLQIILLAMPGINLKLRFAPNFGNRAVRTQLRRMPPNKMLDMLE